MEEEEGVDTGVRAEAPPDVDGVGVGVDAAAAAAAAAPEVLAPSSVS